MTTLTITAKGQVTLNKAVLAHLGAEPGDRVDVDLLPGTRVGLSVHAAGRPWQEIVGMLGNPHRVHLSVEELDEAIGRAAAEAARARDHGDADPA